MGRPVGPFRQARPAARRRRPLPAFSIAMTGMRQTKIAAKSFANFENGGPIRIRLSSRSCFFVRRIDAMADGDGKIAFAQEILQFEGACRKISKTDAGASTRRSSGWRQR